MCGRPKAICACPYAAETTSLSPSMTNRLNQLPLQRQVVPTQSGRFYPTGCLTKALQSAVARGISRTKRIITEITEALSGLDLASCALAVRGSVAQNGSCPFSDVDLVILGDLKQQQDVTASAHRALNRVSLRVSIQEWSLDRIRSGGRSLSFWTTISHMKFVNGDRASYNVCNEILHQRLSSMTLAQLVVLHRKDPRRYRECLSPSSPLSFNIKRGIGGTVDCEYLRLLSCHPHFPRLPTHASDIALRFQAAASTATLLMKEYLHRSAGGPLENYFTMYSSPGTDPVKKLVATYVRQAQLLYWQSLTELARLIGGEE
jgi:hypothetical protein